MRIIDTYTNTDKGLDHYAKILDQRGYNYGHMIAPHDIAVRELGAAGAMSRLETARNLGINFEIAPNLPIEDGIEAVRTMLPRTWIDEKKCEPLIKAISEYRREYDSKNKVYKNRPLHNWASNFCDSLRYMAVSLPKTSNLGTVSPEELDRRYKSAMMGETLPYQFVQKHNLPPF